MFGKPGEFKIPNFEKVKQYLIDNSKTMDEILDLIKIDEMPL